jgi:hypothetical protein
MKLKTSALIGIVFLALLSTGCGGGGGDGTDVSTPYTPSTTTPVILDEQISIQSGLKDGGASQQATQVMSGAVPNPSGTSSATFGGKAYLVLNGNRIQLSVTNASSPGSSGRIIYKDGKEYFLSDADQKKAEGITPKGDPKASITWTFSITFSINAGANTLSIEVYDLNSTLYARSNQWTVVGAIEPSSLVVTLWWDTNQTDIDLHVSPDEGSTHCFYSNRSAGGMVLDYDDVNGFGPEHITLEQATGTKTYKIKVYYYADHNTNDPPGTTPTTAHISATVNGITKLSASSTLSSASTSSGWGDGAHVWDAGGVEVIAPSRYSVVLDAPDLSSYPTVRVTATVTDPNNTEAPKVTGLSASNFYVINAGRSMSPVSVSASENVYTLTYTDIVAGKRDLFVYVCVPAQGDSSMKGGLSATRTYGTNYAVLAGLNEYPAQRVSGNWFDTAAQPTKFFFRAKTGKTANPTTAFTVDAADFVLTLKDLNGGTNTPEITVTATGITAEGWDEAANNYSYLLSFDRPDNYLDYDTISPTFKKEVWLTWCVKDTTDLKAALLATATGMSNTSWVSGNITTYHNTAATKSAILSQIETIAGSMQKYDMLLFHFSGHGSGMPADGNASQYLCTYEDSAWISVNDLKEKLDLVPKPGGDIANIFIFMDACHSGNFIGKNLFARGEDVQGPDSERLVKYRPYMPQAKAAAASPGMNSFRDLKNLLNVFVMAAQTGSSYSWDDGGLQNGVFTHYLVEGINVSGKRLSSALANTNSDAWITGEEAFSYLDPLCQARVTVANGYSAGDFQTPQVQDNSVNTSALLIYNW